MTHLWVTIFYRFTRKWPTRGVTILHRFIVSKRYNDPLEEKKNFGWRLYMQVGNLWFYWHVLRVLFKIARSFPFLSACMSGYKREKLSFLSEAESSLASSNCCFKNWRGGGGRKHRRRGRGRRRGGRREEDNLSKMRLTKREGNGWGDSSRGLGPCVQVLKTPLFFPPPLLHRYLFFFLFLVSTAARCSNFSNFVPQSTFFWHGSGKDFSDGTFPLSLPNQKKNPHIYRRVFVKLLACWCSSSLHM